MQETHVLRKAAKNARNAFLEEGSIASEAAVGRAAAFVCHCMLRVSVSHV
jgi:hypothetical protein